MFTDTHCHLNRLNLDAHGGHLNGAITAMKHAKVTKAMAIMCEFEEYPAIKDIVMRYSDADLKLGMTVGMHPCEDAKALSNVTPEKLLSMAQDDQVWAIGETGLDYYHSGEAKLAQKNSLAVHIEVSKTLGKPLVVHTRNAKQDTLDVLKSCDANHGIVHCFTEDWETGKQALDMGFYLSFSGIVTFKNAISIQEVAKKTPLDRLLIETDSPYLAPVPKRGKPNEPAYVPYVAEYLAELRGMPVEELAMLTTENFERLLTSPKQQ